MTAIFCTALTLLAPPACARGGHAIGPDRGGQALVVLQPIPRVREWTCIHNGEGAWNSNTGNGYFGGLQMDRSFMSTYGGDMIRKYGGWAEQWTPRDQMIVANRAWTTRGFAPWPRTARACGLL